VILADDMGYSDLGCYGSDIHTPNIDALAARGLRFTQFYNCAVCCPTRGSLLTGLYPHQAGMGEMTNGGAGHGPSYQGYLNDRCLTNAEMLRQTGYRTLMSGKWHVGENRPPLANRPRLRPLFRADQRRIQFFRHGRIRPGPRHGPANGGRRPALSSPEGGLLHDGRLRRACGQVYRRGGPLQPPFFSSTWLYNAPHSPLHALPEDIAKYRGRYLEGWDVLREKKYQRMRAMGVIGPDVPLSPRNPVVPAWPEATEHELWDLKMAIYAAQIDRLDQGVGRVVAKLEETGKLDNTLILFLSDNGACAARTVTQIEEKYKRPPYLGGPKSYETYGPGWANLSNTPLRRSKFWTEEGGISTSMVAAWPRGISNRGGFCHQVGHVMDLMPTFAEIAGSAQPDRIQGRDLIAWEGMSLLPSLRGQTLARTKPLFWEFEGKPGDA